MSEIAFNISRTDLFYDNKTPLVPLPTDIEVKRNKSRNKTYSTLFFSDIVDKEKIEEFLRKELIYFFKILGIKKGNRILVVGLGNENHTADSVGPKTLKHLHVNAFLKNLDLPLKVSEIEALEPGVMGDTGIKTERIIKAVIKETLPDLVILIDSFISNNIDYLNKTIEITNNGLKSGAGIKGLTSKLNRETLNTEVLVIGVTTTIELYFKSKEETYLLSSKNVDDYVMNIAKILGNALNSAIESLE